MLTQEERIRISIVGKLGRFRIYLFLVLLLLYLAAYFLGYAVKPGQQFASQVNQEINQEESMINKLSSVSQVAAFSYKLTNLMMSLGPSLIPLFGIWNTAEQWVYAGIATNAVSSSTAVSIMAETILLSIIIAIPSTDGLLLTLLLINYGRNREFRDLTILSLRWYIMSVILAVVFLVLFSAIP
ncbi:hypothetical protein [Vulcanisaeta distributa]|uniref:Uncharacterized protein n=1 Tax=Vulcanisaeta distributa (strain DSM 14429 / JCM 11212 / NBRC 100878 / IC-017) TaxID=572478 RepID=E1QV30_VULDI|nr:hypothetical protein [Vulcanisaeta distributa]ADN51221.1 hypothetical protein Vdis_1849 [Vulcanisaeta distributa DSM 14429]